MDELPRKWWQWFLMYPALIVALLGAGPQFYSWGKGLVAGLPFGVVISQDSGRLLARNKAYDRNHDCLIGSEIQQVKPKTKTNYSIELITCPSGDILITLTSIQNQSLQKSDWIFTSDLFQHASLFSTSAFAQGAGTPPGPTPVEILDAKTTGSVLTKRVKLSNNTCVDEMVDTFTGRLLSRRPAPCVKF